MADKHNEKQGPESLTGSSGRSRPSINSEIKSPEDQLNLLEKRENRENRRAKFTIVRSQIVSIGGSLGFKEAEREKEEKGKDVSGKKVPRAPKQFARSVGESREFQLLLHMETYFKEHLIQKLKYDHYCFFSIINDQDADLVRFRTIFGVMKSTGDYSAQQLKLDVETSRATATLFGLGIADAFGATTEFIPFVKNRKDGFKSFADIKELIRKGHLEARSGRVGIWTDDCSMALCMADSLLLKKYKFDAIHIRYLFHMWLEHGLDNGGRPHSIGLGGNIAISMKEFVAKQSQFADKGDQFNNGNGSIMRLAPIPTAFRDDEEQAMKFCAESSRTTHNGNEAEECCRFLGLILIRLIRRKDTDWKKTLEKACKDFKTKNKSVQFLVESKMETDAHFRYLSDTYGAKFTKYNKSPKDRNWNWKDQHFTYSETRNIQQPGYIGSYCMDALAMALHINWTCTSLYECIQWAAVMGGDCDTVGAIAAQIAGAIYGVQSLILHLYSEMEDFHLGKYDLFVKAYKIATRANLL